MVDILKTLLDTQGVSCRERTTLILAVELAICETKQLDNIIILIKSQR